jgi:ssDNA-binding Zn-finger/Zn-ribbon topoisomerase 1
VHTGPMSETSGELSDAAPTDRKCPKCGAPMTRQAWESSCGGYEDDKYSCTAPACRHVHWVEGIDS